MRILATTDDGIYAPGLWALVAELKQVGKVVVAAPDREQSGVGASVTLHMPLRARRIAPLLKGVTTYVVEGTPADSVILALGRLLRGKVDLVVSGINAGSNMGHDVFISGTVGAAFQGYSRGLPALALSVAAVENVHLGPAARLGAILAQVLGERTLPDACFLNVNLPNLPLEELKGVEVTRLAGRSYRERIKEGNDGKRKYYWIARDKPQNQKRLEPGTDIWAVNKNRISITPIQSDITCPIHTPSLLHLSPWLWRRLKPDGGES